LQDKANMRHLTTLLISCSTFISVQNAGKIIFHFWKHLIKVKINKEKNLFFLEKIVPKDTCPPGWSQIVSTQECYMVSRTAVTFDKAIDYCINVAGGYLATIASQTEYDLLLRKSAVLNKMKTFSDCSRWEPDLHELGGAVTKRFGGLIQLERRVDGNL
jgi:hypothetical protein